MAMEQKGLDRITFNPMVMGGRACIRGMRITVGTVLGLVAANRSRTEILALYPYLEDEDITQSLRYAKWMADDKDLPIQRA